jgi:flagellar biogenesis protein FliO
MGWEYCKAVILIVIIIAAAYYVTKFVAVRAGGPRSRAGEIRIRSTASMGRDRQVVITEIGDSAYILGVTSQHIDLIDKVPLDELNAALPEEPPAPVAQDFKKEFLERLKGTYRDPRQ